MATRLQTLVHVEHLRSNMRERQIRDHNVVGSHLAVFRRLDQRSHSPSNVVVRNHDCLGRSCSSRCVNELDNFTRLPRVAASLQVGVRHLVAKREKLIKGVDWDSALGLDLVRELLLSVHDERL
jgi:hypothetical protein